MVITKTIIKIWSCLYAEYHHIMKRKIIALCSVLLVPMLTVGSISAKAEPGASVDSIRPVSASITVGSTHSCALTSQGAAYCWGNNDNGQLGNGTKANSYTAVPVTNGRDFIAISANSSNTCALSVYKTVWCWGSNFSGQLGDGTKTSSTVPVQVAGISSATAISNLGSSVCALLVDQTVWCWGGNFEGQLGNGTTTSSTVPVQVSGISAATAISGKGWHVCALLATSTVKCWGYGYYGQLGNNTSLSRSTLPVSVSNLTGAIGVAANFNNGCALLNSGTLSCWGRNADYVIGHNRNRGLSLIPETNTLVSSAQSLALGVDHACVLLSDATVKCWGGNYFGQLGNSVKSFSTPNGTEANFYIPEVVAGLSGVVALDANSYSTCALLSNGSVKCWGGNSSGELGNGEIADSYQPVTVMGIGGLVGASTASTTTTTTTIPKTTTTTTTTIPKTTTTTTTTIPTITTSFPPNTYYVAPPSVATNATKPTLSTKKTLSAKSIATYSGLKIVIGSTVSVTVNATSRTICRVSGTTLKAVKKGTCKVVVTVKSRTGKKSSKNLTLNVRS